MLAFGLLGGAVSIGYPRARAAWQVHDLAAKTADYASCMAGPTGPQLIRDDLAEFRRLVRRRLVAAAPDEAPFGRCAKLASVITGSADAERKHANVAARFDEYGLDRQGVLPLSALALDLTPLVERTRAAWPFVRGGFARLIRTSLEAREAMHPVAPARPGLGRGLPSDRALPKRAVRTPDGILVSFGDGAQRSTYVSTDDGTSFRPARGFELEQRGGCGGRDRERGFSLSAREDGSLLVSSLGPSREPSTVTAVLGEHSLVALACDDSALVLAAELEGKTGLDFQLCAHERACVPLRLPDKAPFSELARSNFDLVRVAGATVLAVERRGIVRVVSTRDDGRTWTPPLVAFDAVEAGPIRADVTVPSRLLALGSRLMLYGAARRGSESYPILVSDDQGASFRALSSEPPKPAPAPAPASVAQTR